jgi:hypothetical protein
MFDGDVAHLPGGGYLVACGPSQELRLFTLPALMERDRSLASLDPSSARLAGIALATSGTTGLTPAAEAGGMFIEWMPA